MVARRIFMTAMQTHRGVSANVKQYFDRLVTLPSAADQAILSAWINSLTAAGVFSKLRFLYPFAFPEAAGALVNVISSSFTASLITTSGTPTFVAYRGFTGVGATNCVNSNFNFSTDGGGLYTQDDAMLAAWCLTATQVDSKAILASSANARPSIQPRDLTDSNTNWGINCGGDTHSAIVADTSGFWLMQRTASNAQAIYNNDSATATDASKTSTAPPNTTCCFALSLQCALGMGGASLTAAQRTAAFTINQTMLHAFGAV